MDNKNISHAIESYVFIQKHPAVIRIWHWITFLILTASMITVLINSTLLNPRDNVGMVKTELEKKGVTVSEEQAFAVSHQYEDEMWNVHKLLGFSLLFLLIFRALIEITLPREERVSVRKKNVIGLIKKNDQYKARYKHYLNVKRMYMLFYSVLLLMVLTGLGLAFGRDLGFTRDMHNAVKTVHSLLQYCMYTFVFIHIIGVVIAENSTDKGIVSGMIHGNMGLH